MALSEFQRGVCQLIAANRRASGESYVAGGAALNALLASPRLSRDLDLFHDTVEALRATFARDVELLLGSGYAVEIELERQSFVEAAISKGGESVAMQWTCDSAFRFFPLVVDSLFGLTMHPFDLATNKVLALVGRLEVRDWIDVMHADAHLQGLGFMAWAACGKDPGFNPLEILREARRSGRYSALEVSTLAFEGSAPDAAELSRRWRTMLQVAEEIVNVLPVEHVGACVLNLEGEPFVGDIGALEAAMAGDRLRFHQGSIRGAFPQLC